MNHAELLAIFFIITFIGTFAPAHAYDESRRAAFFCNSVFVSQSSTARIVS